MSARSDPVHEVAHAKLNLVLHVGPPRPNGLHPICSIFASLDLADEIGVRQAEGPADALRAANRLSGDPLDPDALRAIAATLGSDVPSQVEPGHALVAGTGEIVEPIALHPLAAVLVPQPEGLATEEVYAQLDRMAGWREQLD